MFSGVWRVAASCRCVWRLRSWQRCRRPRQVRDGLRPWPTGRRATRLSIGAVSGSLVQSVRVQQLEVNHRALDLMASEVTLSWAPGKLLDGVVFVTSFDIDGVRIDLHEGPFGAEENSPLLGRVFAMPLEVVAQTVNLTDITVARGGDELVVESAEFAVSLSAAEIAVAGLSVSGPDWRLSADGTLVPVKPFELNLQAAWQRRIEDDAQEELLTITGNLQQAGFEVAMQAPFELSASGKVVRTADAYRMEAAGVWRDFQWPLFRPPSVRSPDGDFKLGGALDDFTAELDLELVADTLPSTRLTLVGAGSFEPRGAIPFEFTAFWQALMPQDVTLSGELDASGDMDGIVVSPKILSPFLFSAEAALALAGEPSFEASAEWDEDLLAACRNTGDCQSRRPTRRARHTSPDGSHIGRSAGCSETDTRRARGSGYDD